MTHEGPLAECQKYHHFEIVIKEEAEKHLKGNLS